MKVKKPANILELGKVDVTEIKTLIPRISEKVWNLENAKKENNFDCFHHTRHIIFKFIDRKKGHRHSYSNPIWDVWKSNLLPIMNSVIANYNYKNPVYPKVMLARLAAHSEIDLHADNGKSNFYTHKIHIPIETNKNVRFFVEDESFYLKEGKAYEVNNVVNHRVENNGATDRIHLIFEVYDEREKAQV